MNRRRFLRGLGGVLVALPFLESTLPEKARAAGSSNPFAIFMRQGNGVQQAIHDAATPTQEPERFWPTFGPGLLTTAALEADSGQALSVLSRHAPSLTFLRGLRFRDQANSCKHSGGGNQTLTAADVSKDECNSTKALGESIDNRIARVLGAKGDEPLTLYAGRKTGYLDEVLSYRGPRGLRGAERNPATVYDELFGLAKLTPAERDRMTRGRKSVNDLVRSDMDTLLRRTDLSSEDRARLDLHFSSIRDFEKDLACKLTTPDVTLSGGPAILDDDESIDEVVKLHCDVLVLAIACGLKKAGTLQIGSGPDDTHYRVRGVTLPSFHQISHRDVEGALDLHHEIDRKILGYYGYLLDQLAARPTPEGTLLDEGVAVYCNDLGTGSHSYENVPYLVAGSAGGALRTGQFLDLGGVTNNKILNTLGAALGCTNAAGGPLDDFGAVGLERGRIDAMVAGA